MIYYEHHGLCSQVHPRRTHKVWIEDKFESIYTEGFADGVLVGMDAMKMELLIRRDSRLTVAEEIARHEALKELS